MLHDAGILQVCQLTEVNTAGGMPHKALVPVSRHFYGEYTIGYGRQYAAKGANEQIDLIAEIDADRNVRIGMYCVIGSDQYRVDNVQQQFGNDGLRNTLITLQRLGENYDVNTD